MIKFNVPFTNGREAEMIKEAIRLAEFSGGGYFTKLVEKWLSEYTGAQRVLLTSSCTHALEMCALLCDIQPGDEVIMPSFNFVSAANAFVLRGARIVFVDIRPTTMNVSEEHIEAAITPRTKAILVMHYGGASCDMDWIMELADKKKIWVIEDAAHCIGATYKGRHLGTIGHLGAISFHATKNIHCGEGGALIINRKNLIQRAEVIREKGTNRKVFLQGMVDKYTWVDIGSSYTMSELNAAFLWAQLPTVEQVNAHRVSLWQKYFTELEALQEIDKMECLSYDAHNGHIFFVKTHCQDERVRLTDFLKEHAVEAYFHYLPLHTSQAGLTYGEFQGQDLYTSRESTRLLRLPLHPLLSELDIDRVINLIFQFYRYTNNSPVCT